MGQKNWDRLIPIKQRRKSRNTSISKGDRILRWKTTEKKRLIRRELASSDNLQFTLQPTPKG
jgi:hypothetical protein